MVVVDVVLVVPVAVAGEREARGGGWWAVHQPLKGVVDGDRSGHGHDLLRLSRDCD